MMDVFYNRKHAEEDSSGNCFLYLSCKMTARQALTLFINPTCHLCLVARTSLEAVQKTRAITWREVDITAPGNEVWREAYCFDVPVLHVSPCGKSKIMHWIYPAGIQLKLDEFQGPQEGWKTTLGKKQD